MATASRDNLLTDNFLSIGKKIEDLIVMKDKIENIKDIKDNEKKRKKKEKR